MSRREAWLSAGLVFVVALLVRAWAAAQVPFPIPEDATYYWGVARNLVDGHGLTSNALWSYVTPARDPATGAFGLFFPRPAFEIWLPLPTLLAAIPMLLLGSTSYAATLAVPVLLGALIPVLAWRIGADLAAERGLPPERARTLALGSGLVSAVALPLVLPSALLDSTVPFGVAALAACLLGTRLLREPRGARIRDPRLIGLGVALGVAALSRNEAIWVALAWAALAWWQRPVGPRPARAARNVRDSCSSRPSWPSSSSRRGWSGRRSRSGARCPARPSRTRGRSPATRSSRGGIPRRWRATSPRAPRPGWAIASTGSRTTS